MKSKLLIPAAIALMGVSGVAWAADDGAEATIRLMGKSEAELPDAVTKTISLPAHLLVEGDDQVAAVENAKKGHDIANANVNRDKTLTGQDRAEEARQQGKEMAEKAKEARENRGRADPPGRPEDPGRPDNPGGR